MKRHLIIEVIGLAACLIAAFLLSLLVSTSNANDINLHDTYSVGVVGGAFGPHLTLAWFIFNYFIVSGFCIYLVRVLYFEFKVILTDVIFLVFTGLVLYFLSDILFILHPPIPKMLETTTEPSFNRYYSLTQIDSFADIWLPRLIKILLMLVLAFTSFMIGRNWGLSPKK